MAFPAERKTLSSSVFIDLPQLHVQRLNASKFSRGFVSIRALLIHRLMTMWQDFTWMSMNWTKTIGLKGSLLYECQP